MQAAESPWIMRPAIKKAIVPDGETAIRNEPIMLSTIPTNAIFTRPTRSASPPHNDDEYTGKQRCDAHRDVAPVFVNT